MATTITLQETLDFEGLETKEFSKFPFESLDLAEEETKEFSKFSFEGLDLAEEVLKGAYLSETLSLEDVRFLSIFKTFPNILSLEDACLKYKSQRHQTFEVKIYRNGIWNQDILKEDVLRFDFKKVLTDAVSEGFITFQNADQLDIQEGDQIEFLWQSEGTTLPVRVFLGEIDLIEKEWDEEENEQRIKVLFQDWGKLLLERKITQSYPQVTDINIIIEQILADILKDKPVYIHDRKLFFDSIIGLYATRTIDFVGESLWDCLKKLAFITQSEFFVNEDKELRFLSRALIYSTFQGTLGQDDFSDYLYQIRDDLVCNTCQVYGHPNKPYPEDFYEGDDLLTDSTLYWTGMGDPTNPSQISLVSLPSPKVGDYSVKISISGTAPPGSNDWLEFYQAQGWCRKFPQDYMDFIYEFHCPTSKRIQLDEIACYHQGSSDVKVYYQFGTQYGDWTYVGSIQDGFDWLDVDGEGYAEGSDNQKLYVKWRIGKPSFGQDCCAANFTVHYRYYPFLASDEVFSARIDLPSTIDCESEKGFRAFGFNLFTNLENYSFGGSIPLFQVRLIFDSGSVSTYEAQQKGIFSSGWTEIKVPIGPENTEGWSGSPSGQLIALEFLFTIQTDQWSQSDFLLMDAFYFDEGKWYGNYKDGVSMLDRKDGGYGIKYRKIFDDTIYSDTAAQRWAMETVLRYKEPLIYVKNAQAIIDRIEFMNIGDLVDLTIPETPGKKYRYRIREIRYFFDEEEDFFTELLLERTYYWSAA